MSKEYVMCTYDSAGDLVPLEVRPTSMREAELELEILRLTKECDERIETQRQYFDAQFNILLDENDKLRAQVLAEDDEQGVVDVGNGAYTQSKKALAAKNALLREAQEALNDNYKCNLITKIDKELGKNGYQNN